MLVSRGLRGPWLRFALLAMVIACTEMIALEPGIANVDWHLISISSPSGNQDLGSLRAPPTLRFVPQGPSQGVLGGFDGCNAYDGAYVFLASKKFKVFDMGGTSKRCIGSTIDEIFFRLLSRAD